MKNLYVIVGKSASGKDTILNSLIDKGIGNKIISHTSRPIREGEVDGFSYYFMDKN
jgi:guanylate kinase